MLVKPEINQIEYGAKIPDGKSQQVNRDKSTQTEKKQPRQQENRDRRRWCYNH